MSTVSLVVRDTCRTPGHQPAKREFVFAGHRMQVHPNVPFSIDDDVFVLDLHRVRCDGCGREDTLRQAERKFDKGLDETPICKVCGAVGQVRLQLPSEVMLAEDFDAWWEDRRQKTLRAEAAERGDA